MKNSSSSSGTTGLATFLNKEGTLGTVGLLIGVSGLGANEFYLDNIFSPFLDVSENPLIFLIDFRESALMA